MGQIVIPLDHNVEDRLFVDLEATGFATLENAIDPEFLLKLQHGVNDLLEQRGHRYFSIVEPQKALGRVFAEMADAPGLLTLMRNLTRRGHSDVAVEGCDLYNVLRIIAGNDAENAAFKFHYDATVLTILMPLFIPDGPPNKAGDLIALPNKRGYRRSALMNVAEKILVQNPLACRLHQRAYHSDKLPVFKLKPGNLYFFWGYRTFHANLPCEAGAKRATLLFHFGNPHAGDPLTRTIVNIRRMREQRRLEIA